MLGLSAFAAFVATVPAANWLISHWGTVCVPDGPCLIPVAPGLMAPSGVLMIGLALVLRDVVHRELGGWWAFIAINLGVIASVAVAPPALVLASTAAFLLSEIADLLVYAPLYRRRLILAVAASGVVGAVVDSVIFLWLAFGNLEFLAGQVVGKLFATGLAAAVLASYRLNWRRA